MKIIHVISIFSVACLFAPTINAVGIKDVSDPVPIDTMNGVKYSSGAVSIAFDPLYSDGKAAEASYVVLEKVVEYDTESATTSTLARCVADASGDWSFSVASSEPHRVRLLHSVYDANDVRIGDTLVADLAFPIATAMSSDDAFVDGRTNSLQMCATEAAASNTVLVLPFSYDSSWVTNDVPASFRLTQIRDSVNRSMEVVSSTTNVLIESAMPGSGGYSYTLNPSRGGRYTFFCTFLGSAGDVVGERYSASYYLKERHGLVLVVQ